MLSTSLGFLASAQAQPNFSWGVVYSSDREIQQVKQEREQLLRILSKYRTQAQLFKRRQWYVNVVLFSNEQNAEKARNVINYEYSTEVFVVELKYWCRPNWSQFETQKQGVRYYDCKRGELLQGKTGAIIIDSHQNLPDAQDRIEQLKKPLRNQQHNLAIYYRQGSYHTVVINYANKNEANQKRPDDLSVNGAVEIYQWCPRPILKDNEVYDYIECLFY